MLPVNIIFKKAKYFLVLTIRIVMKVTLLCTVIPVTLGIDEISQIKLK
jgi:hypothetical protein